MKVAFVGCWAALLVALMMEVLSTSETSASVYQTTRRDIREDSYLQDNIGSSYWPVEKTNSSRNRRKRVPHSRSIPIINLI